MEHARPELDRLGETVIAILDPDFVFLEPLTQTGSLPSDVIASRGAGTDAGVNNPIDVVKKGRPVAQRYVVRLLLLAWLALALAAAFPYLVRGRSQITDCEFDRSLDFHFHSTGQVRAGRRVEEDQVRSRLHHWRPQHAGKEVVVRRCGLLHVGGASPAAAR